MEETDAIVSSANGITIRQQTKGKCCTVGPQWNYVSPNPALEANGLTPAKLQEIVEGINGA